MIDPTRECAVEDWIVKQVNKARVIAHYVGRNTSGGCRDLYFYTTDGPTLENTLIQAIVKFTDYQFAVGHRYEPDWSTYLEFLYPSPRDMQLIQNQHLTEVLQESSDRSEVPRCVMHWAYFSEASDREKFVEETRLLEFDLNHLIDPDSAGDRWGAKPFVISSRHDALGT